MIAYTAKRDATTLWPPQLTTSIGLLGPSRYNPSERCSVCLLPHGSRGGLPLTLRRLSFVAHQPENSARRDKYQRAAAEGRPSTLTSSLALHKTLQSKSLVQPSTCKAAPDLKPVGCICALCVAIRYVPQHLQFDRRLLLTKDCKIGDLIVLRIHG